MGKHSCLLGQSCMWYLPYQWMLMASFFLNFPIPIHLHIAMPSRITSDICWTSPSRLLFESSLPATIQASILPLFLNFGYCTYLEIRLLRISTGRILISLLFDYSTKKCWCSFWNIDTGFAASNFEEAHASESPRPKCITAHRSERKGEEPDPRRKSRAVYASWTNKRTVKFQVTRNATSLQWLQNANFYSTIIKEAVFNFKIKHSNWGGNHWRVQPNARWPEEAQKMQIIQVIIASLYCSC